MNKNTILVIEDEASIRENIAEILSLKKYIVLTAQNGSEGLTMAIKNKPSLIISDITMPIMDGLELLKNVRNHKEICNTPFLFLTAKADRSDFRKGMDLGADDYILKPFSVSELISAINSRLNRQQKIEDDLKERVSQLMKQTTDTSSHEYNTPLNGILGFSELILSSYDNFTSKRIKEFVNMIRESGLRLKKTVDRTLLFKNLMSIQKEDLRQTKEKLYHYTINQEDCEIICNKLLKSLERKNEIRINIEPAKVNVDSTYLKIIMEELTENAVKFCDENTKIEITGQIINDQYQLTIYNQGKGFKPEQIDSIAPFTQFERNKFEQQGSGLGLFNVKKICELYDFDFHIESEYAVYAKIIISFKLID